MTSPMASESVSDTSMTGCRSKSSSANVCTARRKTSGPSTRAWLMVIEPMALSTMMASPTEAMTSELSISTSNALVNPMGLPKALSPLGAFTSEPFSRRRKLDDPPPTVAPSDPAPDTVSGVFDSVTCASLPTTIPVLPGPLTVIEPPVLE